MAAHNESSKHHPRSENETGRGGGTEVREGGCLYDTESGRERDEERRKERERESESETPVC